MVMGSQERLGFVHAELGLRKVWFTTAFPFGELLPTSFLLLITGVNVCSPAIWIQTSFYI